MKQKTLQKENSHSTIDYLEHCTTLAVGADTELVEQVHRKAHRPSDPATRQWPRYHCRVETGCL